MELRPTSYRFIFVYRAEPREISGVKEKWRGWVQLVPNVFSNQEAGTSLHERRWLQTVDELPEVVCELMAEN